MIYVTRLYTDRRRTAIGRVRLSPRCKIFSDDAEELQAFMEKSGLLGLVGPMKDNSVVPHYLLTKPRRNLAILHGAVSVRDDELPEILLNNLIDKPQKVK